MQVKKQQLELNMEQQTGSKSGKEYIKAGFFFPLFFISWKLISLQYCSGFMLYIDMNQPWIYMCSPSWTPLPPPSPSHPSGSSQCTSPEHLSHASNLGWWSVSHLIIYMFQCCTLKTSHPRFLPQSPKVCSVHLCLFFCLAYRVIINIFFKFHIYVLVYCIGLYLSGLLHSV